MRYVSVFWDSLLNIDLAREMIAMTVDKDGEVSENVEDIFEFFKYIKEKMSYNYGIRLAENWSVFPENKQVEIALGMVGVNNISKMMLLMDCLNKRIKREKGIK